MVFYGILTYLINYTYSVDAQPGFGIGQTASVRMTTNLKLHTNAAGLFDANMLECADAAHAVGNTPRPV